MMKNIRVIKLFGFLAALLWLPPAMAIQLVGGKPLPRGEERQRAEAPGRAESTALMLHGVVQAMTGDVLMLNGRHFSLAGVPLHGPYGDMHVKDLRPGLRVRVALGGTPNRRKVLALWVLPESGER